MRPTYHPGDVLLGWRWFRPKVGQVVVAQAERVVIKRVEKFDGDQFWLSGDNKALSSGTRKVDRGQVEALIICRFHQGRLPN